MHIDEFRKFQREGSPSNLIGLVMACRRRFLNAARLLEVRSPAIDRLSSFGVDAAVEYWPLLGPFSVIAERYVERFFSPQDTLFRDPADIEDEKWARYFHHVLVPHMLTNDEVVRTVLRAVHALPSAHPEHAARALSQYFAETTLPDTSPAWAPEDVIDG